MVVSEMLHEALVNIGLIACAMVLIPGWMYIIWQGVKEPVMRFIIRGVWKLDRAMKRAEMRRIRREQMSMMRTEHIPGTNGYRICPTAKRSGNYVYNR